MMTSLPIEPIILENIKVDGFSLTFGEAGDSGEFLQTAIFTSFEEDFHTYSASIINLVQKAFPVGRPAKVDWLLIRINKQNQAKVYIDHPVVMKISYQKSVAKGDPIYDKDLIDIHGFAFEYDGVPYGPEDNEQIICILRDGFTFCLYFDFSRELTAVQHMAFITESYKQLKYRILIESVGADDFILMMKKGWFPFIRLGRHNYQTLRQMYVAGKEKMEEKWLGNILPNSEIKKIVSSWWTSKPFSRKKKAIEEGIQCYLDGQFAACISTLTPLVEGILSESHLMSHGNELSHRSAKITKAVAKMGTKKFGTSISAALPKEFAQYIDCYFFKQTKGEKKPATRHSVVHGRTKSADFTMIRCIQLILTLDQIYFLQRPTQKN